MDQLCLCMICDTDLHVSAHLQICPTSGSFGDPSLMDQLHHVEPLTSDRAVSAYCHFVGCPYNNLELSGQTF